MNPARRGSLLLIVVGLSAMLATLATTFLVEVRARSERPSEAVRSAQARLALYAACSFIVECDGARPGIYPLYALRWQPDHMQSGYSMGRGMRGWIVEGGRFPAPRPEPVAYGESPSGAIRWDVAPGSPSESWFRIDGSGSTVTVEVGVGGSRGLRNPGEAARLHPEVRTALGVPANAAELADRRAEEYRERWRITFRDGRIQRMERTP